MSGPAPLSGSEGRPVLIAGIPRSGTTWVGEVLNRTAGSSYLFEPDNDQLEPAALRAKRGLGRYPALGAADDVPAYARMWERAFSGGATDERVRARAARRLMRTRDRVLVEAVVSGKASPTLGMRTAGLLAPRGRPRSREGPLIVKSVYAALAMEWLVARWAVRVLIVLRDPLNTLSSWLELGYPDPALDRDARIREQWLEPMGIREPSSGSSRVTRLTWNIALLSGALRAGSRRHPEWLVAAHEDLCDDSEARVRATAQALGLTWTDSAGAYLRAADRPGSGYQTARVVSRERNRWRERLTSEQVDDARRALDAFPPDLRLSASEP